MIALHPQPQTGPYSCPFCSDVLSVKGWYMPGMRMLADLRCEKCERRFYGDLPAGHGLYYPMLLERASGRVYSSGRGPWFREQLEKSFARRQDVPLPFRVERHREPRHAVLLNCLDQIYGHSLLKLLNAQHYLDGKHEADLVVLVPEPLRWMVPDGVAEIWTVDPCDRRGATWSDWLHRQILDRVRSFETCKLSLCLPHPHPDDFDIARFTRVPPFAPERWADAKPPTVTFVWRENRAWVGFPHRTWTQRLRLKLSASSPRARQARSVIALEAALRRELPEVDFAVAGLGTPEGFPTGVADLRSPESTPEVERGWCERYARSHVVVGVQGSNMLLPSAHAGATVNLVLSGRWSNQLQDILLPPRCDPRDALCRSRFLPLDTAPELVAQVVVELLRWYPASRVTFQRPWTSHEATAQAPARVARAYTEATEFLEESGCVS